MFVKPEVRKNRGRKNRVFFCIGGDRNLQGDFKLDRKTRKFIKTEVVKTEVDCIIGMRNDYIVTAF